MEQQIKQRLVGAVVLVALAVIFLPMVLNGPPVGEGGAIPRGMPVEPTPTHVPPTLSLSSAPSTVLPVEGETRGRETPPAAAPPAPEGTARSAPAPQSKPSPKPSPKPAAKSAANPTAASPVSWSVQVGSFTEKAKAFHFRDRLRKAHFAAYVVDPSGGSHYFKVRVGPELEKARALALMKRLAAEKKIKGFVVKHQ
ncbi:SPOR domain-containing protein [Endothiovibrio diazotrophicus]